MVCFNLSFFVLFNFSKPLFPPANCFFDLVCLLHTSENISNNPLHVCTWNCTKLSCTVTSICSVVTSLLLESRYASPNLAISGYCTSLTDFCVHCIIILYCNRAVCHSVRLLQVFLVAHWKLRAEISNASRYRYLLGFVFKNFRFKASFVSYGVICLPC